MQLWMVIVGWLVCGLLALAMQFRDKPAMRENVGWAETWPVILGPIWLLIKLYDWILAPGTN